VTSTVSEIGRIPAASSLRCIHQGLGALASTPVTLRVTNRGQPSASSMRTG
jgi:hypothetical protein